MLGRRRERLWHLEALRRTVRSVGTPRAVCLGLLRSARYDLDEGHLARGVVLARQAAEVAHASKIEALEVEAEALASNFLRELGDVQGALAACDRALAAFGPSMNGKVPPRLRAEVLRSRGVLLRRVGRVREAVDAYVDAIAIFEEVRRPAHGGARQERARVRDVRPGPLRGRHRARPRVDPDRPLDRRPLPDRQDAHEHRALLLPPRRRHRGRSRTSRAHARPTSATATRTAGRRRCSSAPT